MDAKAIIIYLLIFVYFYCNYLNFLLIFPQPLLILHMGKVIARSSIPFFTFAH